MEKLELAEAAERVQEYLDAELEALREICPTVEDVHVGSYTVIGRYTAWCGVKPVEHSTYDSSLHGHGSTVAEALEALREKAGSHQRLMDSLWQCRADGCDAEAVVTTGEGRMCGHHGMEWLRGEAMSAEETLVGPCRGGVR